ncbi:collagenase [Ferrimonas sediminicola]|uniref:Collagenase n=2 Tax=Ferrimonas sediminicola TaxID=2569538 RepID=A0A4U1B9H6_9GAMM|nr:collagenase [Ferrimonas sediminicola]
MAPHPRSHREALFNHLQYLRAYSYFADVDLMEDAQIQQLHRGLMTLGQTLDRQTPELLEQWGVLLYRFYRQDGTGQDLDILPQLLANQLASFETVGSGSAIQDYALWELLRSAGMLLESVRRVPDSLLKQQLLESELDQALLSFAASDGAQRPSGDWPQQNAYWALAMWQLNQPAEIRLLTEQRVAKLARDDQQRRGAQAGRAFTLGFLVNAFLGQQACTGDYADLCTLPKEEEILPIEHRCSDSLYIRAQDLTEAELNQTCGRLTSQEQDFHLLLATDQQPVADDHNDALKVVVFKNWSQYNAYGQLLFDIDTDNGGMYIEGNPGQAGNQATFYAYRAWWQEEFQVWNLNHEYIHYLDGRFVKYGGFGHFPGKMVWWAEGMAEYVSKGHDNPQAMTLARDYGVDNWPSLEEIFATHYTDGLDRTYRWSYLAVRYFCENNREALQALGRSLKGNDFTAYDQALLALARENQADFNDWLSEQVDAMPQEMPQLMLAQAPQPRRENRYSYRDYLKPVHLASGEEHLHL